MRSLYIPAPTNLCMCEYLSNREYIWGHVYICVVGVRLSIRVYAHVIICTYACEYKHKPKA